MPVNKNKTAVNFKILYIVSYYLQIISFHLDYGDIIYDRAYNTLFHQNIESIQYNASLAIAGAARGLSREKLYQKSGFESLKERRWYSKLCCLFKIINNQSSSYLSQLVPHLALGILDKTLKIFLNFAKSMTFLKAYLPPELNKGGKIWTWKSENLKALIFSKVTFYTT